VRSKSDKSTARNQQLKVVKRKKKKKIEKGKQKHRIIEKVKVKPDKLRSIGKPEEEKEGYGVKNLQKRKVLSLE